MYIFILLIEITKIQQIQIHASWELTWILDESMRNMKICWIKRMAPSTSTIILSANSMSLVNTSNSRQVCTSFQGLLLFSQKDVAVMKQKYGMLSCDAWYIMIMITYIDYYYTYLRHITKVDSQAKNCITVNCMTIMQDRHWHWL